MNTPEIFAGAILKQDNVALKRFAMLIAMSVRNEMESFHIKHLSDAQMKELNPLIRKGVYSALFAISNYHLQNSAKVHIDYQQLILPPYWEEPELNESMKAQDAAISDESQVPEFQSTFLREQWELGNIFYNSKTHCIELLGSYDFKGVEGAVKRHRHRDKISAALRKEGFSYAAHLMGYCRTP